MRVLLGMGLGVALVLTGVFLYFRLGFAPVATAAKPMPFEPQLAEAALHARIEKDAPTAVPISADAPNLAAGVQIYREHCAMCHGLRGLVEGDVAKGMFPKPPQFLAQPARGGSPGQTFWAVKNGIRLTGMPGFAASMTDEQIWQVSLMLGQRDKLPEDLERLLSMPAEPASASASQLIKP